MNISTIAHYTILRSLGKGGMGEVYLARDTKLGRRVALKLLPEHAARDTALRRRLEQEARSVAALHHPNVVTLFAVEEDAGRVFLTMEFVDGSTLGHVLAGGPLPLSRLLDLALPLTEAVGAAHDHGIVHRDLKPSNVMIGKDGRLKVLDFGLAKQLQTEPTSDTAAPTSLTVHGSISGTFTHMSPEQAQGKDVDARSDVFSLGVILYEMAAGKLPFPGDNAVAVMSAILKDEPAPLSEATPPVPAELARIIGRCLSKNPDDRYTTASELHRDLEVLKRDVDSGQALKPARAVSTVRSRALVWAAMSIPVLIAVGYFVWQSATAPRQNVTGSQAADPFENRIIVLPFENLGSPEDSYFAEGISDEIISRLTTVPRIGVISRTTAARYDRRENSLQEIANDLGVKFVLEGTVRWTRSVDGASRVRITPQLVRASDGVSVWSNVFDRELVDVFSIQGEIATSVAGSIDASLLQGAIFAGARGQTSSLQAYDHYLKAQKDAQWAMGPGRDRLERARRLLEEAVALDPEFAMAHASLSQVLSAMQFRFQSEVDVAAASRDAATAALELSPDLAEAHLAMGLYEYRVQHDYDRALQELETASRLAPGSGEIVSWTGTIRKRQGRTQAARELLERALQLDPQNPTICGELAVVAKMMGDFAASVAYSERAENLNPEPSTRRFRAFTILAWKGDLAPLREALGQEQDRSPRAWTELLTLERRYEEALATLAELPAAEVGAREHLARALLHRYLGDSTRSRSAAREAVVASRQEEAGAPRPSGYLVGRLSVALAAAGDEASAVRQIERALMPPTTVDALEHADVLELAAEARLLLGQDDEAVALLEARAKVDRTMTEHLLRIHPRWDRLRKHAAYPRLLELFAVSS